MRILHAFPYSGVFADTRFNWLLTFPSRKFSGAVALLFCDVFVICKCLLLKCFIDDMTTEILLIKCLFSGSQLCAILISNVNNVF